MKYEIAFEPHALDSAARFLKKNPSGLAALVLNTIDKLADGPRPAASTPYGSPDIRRLRVGDSRVLYIIDKEAIHILVTCLSKSP